MVFEFLNDGFLKLSTHRLFGNRNTASYKKAARKLLPRKPNNPLIITLSPTSLPSQEFFCYLNFPVSSFKYIQSIHKTLLNQNKSSLTRLLPSSVMFFNPLNTGVALI